MLEILRLEGRRNNYSYSENKGADQICIFVFEYAKCWFSHDVAQMSILEGGHKLIMFCYNQHKANF